MTKFGLGMILGFCLGWMSGHSEVKRECLVQGDFYVSNTVFICSIKEND